MSKESQIKCMTDRMAHFVTHISKVLPDDVTAKLEELRK